jgi:hypothetical protein
MKKTNLSTRRAARRSLCQVLMLLVILTCSTRIFAAGSSDEYPFEPVSGESHWSYTVNLEDKEEGKHNLVIRSVDEAGNIRYEGPYDFHVDPSTDIPSVAVAHPRPGARVGRMLPIIGTARDDDGVARVEVSINDGSWRPAVGAEAWSAVLDAGALGDGPHTMSVRSIDVNGIESPAVIVPFVVDTSAPVGGVTEPVSGALISGKTSFSGVLEDPNGVEILEISRDGGETWDFLRFSKNKETGAADFSVDLDSRDLEDGPVVWWFRAVDTQGSLSEVPFLFFVDNQGPVVNLELPFIGEDEYEPVPGNVFLAGTATDQSGIDSLRIIVEKNEPIDIPITPGNPWWTWPLDLSGMKDKQANVLIVAADGAGNVSEIDLRIPLDVPADQPVLTIDGVEALAEKVFPSGGAYLTGTFDDDDGGGAISWKIGDVEGRLEGVERAWRFDLPDLSYGSIEMELTPEDRFGLLGESQELSFRVAPNPPIISINSVLDNTNEAPQDWEPGTVMSYLGGSIQGTVVSDSGKAVVLTYIPEGGENTELSLKADAEDSSRLTFQIPVRKGEEPGSRNFILRAADGFGGEAVLGSGFYIQAEPDESGNVSDPRRGDEDINLPLPFLRERDGAAILRNGQALQGWTSGKSTDGARLEPESPFLSLSTKGSSFTIENSAPGLSEPVSVVLADGTSSRPIVVLTDQAAPSWDIDVPESGAWSAGALIVSGRISDDGGIAAASWSLGNGPSTAIELDDLGDDRYEFDFTAEFSSQTDGVKALRLRGEDLAGNISEYSIPFVLDTQAPTLSMAVPPSGKSVGAKSTLVYQVSGNEMLEELSLTVDGENRVFSDQASLYALSLDLAGYETLPETFGVRAVDRAGNITEQMPNLSYDPVSDRPVAYIQTPVDKSVVRGPADLAGLVADDDSIEAVFWRIDGGDWEELPGGASFRMELPLSSLVDGSHLVEVYAVDAAGNAGEVDSAWFDVTRREAEVALLSPEVGTTNRGVFEITGTAKDANGIAGVWVSFDNGHTFAQAEGATNFNPSEEVESGDVPAESNETPETDSDAQSPPTDEVTDEPTIESPVIRDGLVEWRYAMDTGVLNDGVHTLLIKVVDGAGDEALLAGLLEVDNTPPLLALGDPEEGSIQTGSVLLEGRVMDTGGLAGFNAVIERNGEALLEYTETPDGVFHIPFDFAGLEAGKALLRIEAVDTAGNDTAVSRSFIIEPGRRTVIGEIDLPVQGGREGPYFKLAGSVENAMEGDTVRLILDGEDFEELILDERNRFTREFVPGQITEGDHEFRIDVVSSDGERTEGSPREFSYRAEGAWIVIDGFPPGMAVGSRPLLIGRTGFKAEEPPEDDKDAQKAYKTFLKVNSPDRVEVSIDGGLTFEKAKGVEDWEFRIETGEMGEGDLPILVRTRTGDDWTYARTLLRLDKTLPDLRLNESVADGRYNGEFILSGTAGDDRLLDEVSISVRPGSQGRYEVPSFIQGMYFDASVLGATWFDAGLGVTFFEDNVKLQIQVGSAPEEVWDKDLGKMVAARVSGTALGATLLANVAYLPLGYLWGPNWDRLSVSLAIGANFTYFTRFTETGGGVMSSVVVQTEIPRIDFPDRRFFTYVAPYLEGQLWFFSSDVSTTPRLTGSFGVRVGLL